MAFFPRTLGVFTDFSASALYRIQRPFMTMQRCGYPVGLAYVHEVDDRMLQFYDMIVVNRTGGGDPEKIRKAFQLTKKNAKVLVLDYDDDVLNVPDHNPGKPNRVDGIIAALDEAHGVVVTNNTLRAAFKPYVRHMAVVPNYMDPRSWPLGTPRMSEKLVIGLTGTPSHVKDWKIVAEPMKQIMAKYGDRVDFLIAGFLPDYLQEVNTLFEEWVPLNRYPYLINSIDIGLCPLIDDHFNRCKTPIKALELGMAGAAVIASPTQYRDVVKSKGTIANTETQWYDAIEKYVIDAGKRRFAGRNLRDYAETRWDIWRHVELVANAYKDLYLRCLSPLGAEAKAA